MTSQYDLYVPTKGTLHNVRPGSAIVGESAGDLVETDYEGGGASNIQTFEEKIHHAAGRRRESYPTVARRAWHPDDVRKVGEVAYDAAMRRWVITRIDDLVTLRTWVGDDEPLVIGGSDPLVLEAGGQALARLSAHRGAQLIASGGTALDVARAAIAETKD